MCPFLYRSWSFRNRRFIVAKMEALLTVTWWLGSRAYNESPDSLHFSFFFSSRVSACSHHVLRGREQGELHVHRPAADGHRAHLGRRDQRLHLQGLQVLRQHLQDSIRLRRELVPFFLFFFFTVMVFLGTILCHPCQTFILAGPQTGRTVEGEGEEASSTTGLGRSIYPL